MLAARLKLFAALLALAASLGAFCLTPLFSIEIRMDAQYESRTASAAPALLAARLTLLGQRSIWNKATTFGRSSQKLDSALRSCVEASIASARIVEINSSKQALERWGQGFESACSAELSSTLGGNWSAKLTPGFTLAEFHNSPNLLR